MDSDTREKFDTSLQFLRDLYTERYDDLNYFLNMLKEFYPNPNLDYFQTAKSTFESLTSHSNFILMNFKNLKITDNESIKIVMKFNSVFDAIDLDFRSISPRNLVMTVITIESLNQILMNIVKSFTREKFKSLLEFWANFITNQCHKINAFKIKINEFYPDTKYCKIVENACINLSRLSKPLLRNFEKFNARDSELIENIKTFISSSMTIEQIDFDKIEKVYLPIIPDTFESIERRLTAIVNSFAPSSRFKYEYNVDAEAAAELEKYVNRGIMINSKPGYPDTPIGKLEDFAIRKRVAIEEHIGKELIMNENDKFDRLFHAIVAPSMEGKTQAAFTFKAVRPLYFLLSDAEMSATKEIQFIYKNFITLSEKLKEMAEFDLKTIEKSNANTDNSLSIFEQVSTAALIENHSKTKFLSLGFIVSLIEDAQLKYNPENSSWMKFFATSSRDIEILGLSFKDVRNLSFSGYVLFFDEFRGTEWAVLIRNIVRAVKFTAFFANTNTDAAHFVGKQHSGFSRTEAPFAWSLVTVRLNPEGQSALDVIDNQFLQIAAAISRRAGVEQVLVYKFLSEFMMDQFNHFRPGFTELIIKAISSIPLNQEITLNILLETIISALAFGLKSKKPDMCSSLQGISGTLSLFMNNSYLITDKSEIYHLKSFLEDHFYYLINPVNDGNWCFLAYPPVPTSKTTRPQSLQPESQASSSSQPDSNHAHLIYLTCDGIARSINDWTDERTFFKQQETIAFLALQSLFSSKSIPYVLKTGHEISTSDAESLGTSANTSQNITLDDDLLEVITTICVIEASQHAFGSIQSTFSGQNGITFLNNLVENLIEEDNFRRQEKIRIDFNLKIAADFLSSIHIPFLFPSGMELPEFFEKNLNGLKGFNNRSVHFGTFKITRKSNFSYFFGNRRTISVENCSIECKNWSSNFPATELILILQKAKNSNSQFSLLVCNSMGFPSAETQTSINRICEKNRYNIFILSKKAEKPTNTIEFELVPFFPKLKIINNAAINCIILPLDIIN